MSGHLTVGKGSVIQKPREGAAPLTHPSQAPQTSQRSACSWQTRVDHKVAFTTHYTWTIYFFHLNKLITSFIHSFIHSIFTEHHPHAPHCSRLWKHHRDSSLPSTSSQAHGEVDKLRRESLSRVDKAVTGMEVQETPRRAPHNRSIGAGFWEEVRCK